MRGEGRSATLGLAMVLTLSLIWGVNWPILKIGMTEIPPWTFRTIMLGLGGPLLLGVVWLSGTDIRVPRDHWLKLFGVSLPMIVIWTLFSGYGIRLVRSSDAVILAYSMPAWSALFGVLFLGERFTARRAMGLACGLAGVLVLVSRAFGALGASTLGLVLLILAAMLWALGIVAHKAVVWRMPTDAVAGWQVTLGALPTLLGALAIEHVDFASVSWAAWGAEAFNVVIIAVGGYILWFRIMTLFSATVVGVAILLAPVIGVFAGTVMLGEQVGWREVSALALIVMAISLVIFEPAPAAKPQTVAGE